METRNAYTIVQTSQACDNCSTIPTKNASDELDDEELKLQWFGYGKQSMCRWRSRSSTANLARIGCPKTIVKKERKKKITNITENKAKDKNMKNHKKRKK